MIEIIKNKIIINSESSVSGFDIMDCQSHNDSNLILFTTHKYYYSHDGRPLLCFGEKINSFFKKHNITIYNIHNNLPKTKYYLYDSGFDFSDSKNNNINPTFCFTTSMKNCVLFKLLF